MSKEKFYITTAIAYTSKKPHIGNTYEIVLTDAIARFNRFIGKDVFFLTGTDEHGQKIQEIAENEGITPKQHVDKIAGQIKDIADMLNISYDKFIRTTDDYHVKAVQQIFKKLYDQGDIYKSEYEGWYCTPCESFWTETQLVDGKCPDCGREVKKAKEEAYFFKTGKYADMKAAVTQAMKEVSGAIVGIILVLLAVFIPTAFIGGITGMLYKQFALTIAAATVISGFNALTLSPALCALFLKPAKPSNFFLFKGFNKFFEKTTNGYTWVVQGFIRKSALAILAFLVLAILAFIGFLRLPTTFVPNEDQGYFMVSMQLPDGSSLSRTESASAKAGEILKQIDGVKTYIAINGFSMMDNAQNSNAASIFVMLENWDKRKSKALGVDAITTRFNELAYLEIPEAQSYAVSPPPIPGLGESSGFELMVEDINNYGSTSLQQAVNHLVDAGNETPGLSMLRSTFSASVPQYYLNIDRDKVELMQIPIGNVFNALSAYIGSIYVNNFVKYGRTFQVKLQGLPDSRRVIDDVLFLNVKNTQGEMVPFSAFTTVEQRLGAELLPKYNTYSAASLSGSAALGYSSGQALSIMQQVFERELGNTFGYEWTGLAYQEESAGSTTTMIFILAILVAFLILAAQYESWTSPFAVIMGLPIALLGVVIGCLAMNLPISVYTQIGIILLIALTAKNAILIVEFARDYRTAGKPISEAAIEAGKVRLRPILMTSFAFILGVFPLVVSSGAGAASRISLGIAVFAGMLMTSLVGTLFMPNFYYVMQSLQERLTQKRLKS